MRRKTFLHTAAVLALALSATPGFAAVPVEWQNLQALYQAALAEGGNVVVYAGGDTAGQQDGFKAAFEKQFPGITLHVVVDYSKFHNARLEYQFARNAVKADLVMLQTLQDFPRWKAEGRLLNYKPAGWNAVYPDFKDKDGAFVGVFVDAFSNVVNTQQLTPAQIPTDGMLAPDASAQSRFVLPKSDPFVSWAQRAAILKQAAHPAAAKLYLN